MNVPEYTGMFSRIDIYNTKQGYLEQGLRYIRRIMQAETTENRFKLIQKPLYGQELLNESFEHAYMSPDIYDQAGNLVPGAMERLPKPWYADSDGGPESAWYWAHRSQRNVILCGSLCQAPLRQWGYVMWDSERLEALVDFSKPWEHRDYGECVDEQEDKKREDMEKHRDRARYFVSHKMLTPDHFFGAY